jgi:hypothetical protein
LKKGLNFPIVNTETKGEIIYQDGHEYRVQAQLERDRRCIEIFLRVVLGSQVIDLFNISLGIGARTTDLEETKKPKEIEELGEVERDTQRISEVLKSLPYLPQYNFQQDKLISQKTISINSTINSKKN